MAKTDIAAQIQDLRAKVDEAETQHAKAQGRVEEITRRLQTEYQCDDLEQAETLLEKLRGDVQHLDEKIRAGVEAIQAKYLSEEAVS